MARNTKTNAELSKEVAELKAAVDEALERLDSLINVWVPSIDSQVNGLRAPDLSKAVEALSAAVVQLSNPERDRY